MDNAPEEYNRLLWKLMDQSHSLYLFFIKKNVNWC